MAGSRYELTRTSAATSTSTPSTPSTLTHADGSADTHVARDGDVSGKIRRRRQRTMVDAQARVHRRTVLKLDCLLLPFLATLFLFNSLDKSNVCLSQTTFASAARGSGSAPERERNVWLTGTPDRQRRVGAFHDRHRPRQRRSQYSGCALLCLLRRAAARGRGAW
jgi:hypothetical protein